MARVIYCLAVVLLLTGCANQLVLRTDGALAVFPRKNADSGHILVDTMVNGRGPFRFALDTGASISVLFESTAAAADIKAHSDKQVHLQGMTGSGTFPLAYADRIRVGSESWDSPLLAMLPNNSPISGNFDGILGIDFLGQYAVAYSSEEDVIRLYPGHLVQERNYRGWSTIPLYEMRVASGDATIFIFEMSIAGQRIPTIFDLGSDASLMNRDAAKSIGVHTRKRRDDSISGAFGSTIYATKLVFWEVWLGNQRWHRRNFLVADFPVFEALSLQRRPAAIAGVDLFRNMNFVIDFARKRLLVTSRKK